MTHSLRFRIVRRTGVIILLAAFALLTWRATSLNGLPDIGDPFDVAAFSCVNIRDNENAFTLYRQAATLYQAFDPDAPPSADWSTTTANDRGWLESNRKALDLWKRGTERPDALYVRPDELNFDTNFDLLIPLRRMVQLAGLEGGRLEAEGDLAATWTWHRAALRSSRHLGRRGTIIERLVGASMHAAACNRIRNWLTNPAVDRRLLGQTLDEFQEIDRMTPPTSDCIKAEYLGFVHSIDQPEMMRKLLRMSLQDQSEGGWNNLKASWLAVNAVLIREPVRSRRVFRLLVADWLTYCDLPSRQQPSLAGRARLIYERQGASALRPQRLSPEQLESWFDSTILIRLLMPSFTATFAAIERERATYDTLLVQLATKLYELDHGEPPESDEELVGRYLRSLPASRQAPLTPSRSRP